jgi:hypothetical protein
METLEDLRKAISQAAHNIGQYGEDSDLTEINMTVREAGILEKKLMEKLDD